MKFLSGEKLCMVQNTISMKRSSNFTTSRFLTCIQIFARKLLLDMTKAKIGKERNLLPTTNDT